MSVHATEKTPLQNDVTVILLESNDPAYRARAVHYYQAQHCRWLVIDATGGDDCQACLLAALCQLDTPYVVLVKDSDFLLTDMLCSAVNWLQFHPQDQAAQGYMLGYRPSNSQVTYHKLGDAVVGSGVDARSNIERHANCGLPLWRAVVRRDALVAALAGLPLGLSLDAWLTALSFSLAMNGRNKVLESTAVIVECSVAQEQGARDESLADLIRTLRDWDTAGQRLCVDEQGFAVLQRFVRRIYPGGDASLLFTSSWASMAAEPQRSFGPRQYVELPYYNAHLFSQLSAMEFLIHAWPAGQAHVQALEGSWVRQFDLVQVHPNDTPESLKARYWQALDLGLFNSQVCRNLVSSLTDEDDQNQLGELKDWLLRLDRVPSIDLAQRLSSTRSGKVLESIAASTPDEMEKKRVLGHLAARQVAEIAFVVLDTDDDDAALQATFDSVLASGLRNFRIIVLKAGKLPAITTSRDTLHFIKVTPSNLISHLNQVVRQMPSEWVLLLQAGDVLTTGGLLRLQVELAGGPGCQAISANEIQRDADGRLISIERPGADLDLLRGRPDLMSRHWLLRREVVLGLGGYSETNRHALEFDLLLRLVEQYGVGGLAYMDEYLVITKQGGSAMAADVLATLNRHLAVLGYRGQVQEGGKGRLHIDFRHPSTPYVSILLPTGDDLEQLRTCLTSILQRTRYPRFEVLVVSDAVAAQSIAAALGGLQGEGGRVRVLIGDQSASVSELVNLAAQQARGEYLVLMNSRCQVVAPAWIEALLNQAQRPEVGVVGAQMYGSDNAISHAGYELLDSRQVHSTWLGLASSAREQSLGVQEVRSSQAVSGDCLMVRKEVFDHCGGLQALAGADIDLCLQVAQAGLLVLCTPDAPMFNERVPVVPQEQLQALVARWSAAFNRRAAGVCSGAQVAEVQGSKASCKLAWINDLRVES